MFFEDENIDNTEVNHEDNQIQEPEPTAEETVEIKEPEPTEQTTEQKTQKTQKTKKKYSKGQVIFVSVIAVFLAIVLSTQITFVVFSSIYKTSTYESNKNAYFFSLLNELQGLYDANYLYSEEIDISTDDMLKQYVALTGDKYAYYYTAEEWYEEQYSLQGTNAGIGAYVTVNYLDDVIYIIHVFKDSPAEQAGLQAGDIVIGVDGLMFSDIGVDVGFNSIAGEAGTTVTLIVDRNGSQIEITPTRGHYTYESVLTKIIDQDGHKIGYIHILEFMGTTPEEFKNASKQMVSAGCEGIVIDLRNNPGGQLDSIVDVLDYIEPAGEIVQIYKKDGTKLASFNSDRAELDIPLAVLCNESTASAAELMTRSLMDSGKAESFGVLTYGKGCGQSGFKLSNGSVVYITSFYYKTPQSDNYDGIGITPTHVVDYPDGVNSTNIFIIPMEDDAQLQAALNSLINK